VKGNRKGREKGWEENRIERKRVAGEQDRKVTG
jgi:hypothetical protein